MNESRESFLNELDQVLELYRKQVEDFRLTISRAAVAKHLDTWRVPVLVGATEGDAGELSDLLRTIRRTLEKRTNESVSVLLDMADAA